MTECTILKSFPFSRDGSTTEQAEAGQTVDIPGDLVAGLSHEGFVEKAPPKVKGKIREAAVVMRPPDNKMDNPLPPEDNDGPLAARDGSRTGVEKQSQSSERRRRQRKARGKSTGIFRR